MRKLLKKYRIPRQNIARYNFTEAFLKRQEKKMTVAIVSAIVLLIFAATLFVMAKQS